MRKAIENHLGKHTQATVRQIADATGFEVNDIAKELNKMKASGDVERERPPHKVEYVWWLAQTSKPAPVVEAQKPAGGDSEGGETDVSVEEKALGKTIAAAAADEIRELRARLTSCQVTMGGLNKRISALTHDLTNATTANGLLRETVDGLQAELAHAQINIKALREQLDAKPDFLAAAYLVRAPKRKHAVVSSRERAQKLALAAARNGSGKGEVFALAPIGKAVRGAEWKDAA